MRAGPTSTSSPSGSTAPTSSRVSTSVTVRLLLARIRTGAGGHLVEQRYQRRELCVVQWRKRTERDVATDSGETAGQLATLRRPGGVGDAAGAWSEVGRAV